MTNELTILNKYRYHINTLEKTLSIANGQELLEAKEDVKNTISFFGNAHNGNKVTLHYVLEVLIKDLETKYMSKELPENLKYDLFSFVLLSVYLEIMANKQIRDDTVDYIFSICKYAAQKNINGLNEICNTLIKEHGRKEGYARYIYFSNISAPTHYYGTFLLNAYEQSIKSGPNFQLYDVLLRQDFIETIFKVPKDEKKNGCYVATCVYGSYDCPQVWVLRRYRDFELNKTFWGRLFIRIYYFVSPKIVSLFGNNKLFKSIFRKKLDKLIIKCKKLGYSDTQYIDLY